MKVSEAHGGNPGVVGTAGREEKRIAQGEESGFQASIRKIQAENCDERLRDIAAQIVKQGEKLGKKVDIRELRIYKKLISEFLDEAVNNSHKFSKEGFLDRRGRYKVYAVIKKVNSELDSLTQEVLRDEKDNLSVLQRIDDIRGLILDIIL